VISIRELKRKTATGDSRLEFVIVSISTSAFGPLIFHEPDAI